MCLHDFPQTHCGSDEVIRMYKWYFGTDNVPEYKADALFQIVLGIGTGCVALGALFVMVVKWWLCI